MSVLEQNQDSIRYDGLFSTFYKKSTIVEPLGIPAETWENIKKELDDYKEIIPAGTLPWDDPNDVEGLLEVLLANISKLQLILSVTRHPYRWISLLLRVRRARYDRSQRSGDTETLKKYPEQPVHIDGFYSSYYWRPVLKIKPPTRADAEEDDITPPVEDHSGLSDKDVVENPTALFMMLMERIPEEDLIKSFLIHPFRWIRLFIRFQKHRKETEKMMEASYAARTSISTSTSTSTAQDTVDAAVEVAPVPVKV